MLHYKLVRVRKKKPIDTTFLSVLRLSSVDALIEFPVGAFVLGVLI